MASYLRFGRAPAPFVPVTIGYTNMCFSGRQDSPYLTPVSGTTVSTTTKPVGSYLFGKQASAASGGFTNRKRFGMSFPIATSYPGATGCILKITMTSFLDTLESFVPEVYASNTDDHALYSTGSKSGWDWELNANTLLTPALSYGVTTQQTIVVPMTLIAAAAGSHLCFVVGESLEILNGGVGDINGNAGFQMDPGGGFPPSAFLFIS